MILGLGTDLVDIGHGGTGFPPADGLPGDTHFLGEFDLRHPQALSFFSDLGSQFVHRSFLLSDLVPL